MHAMAMRVHCLTFTLPRQARYGNGVGGVILLAVPLLAIFNTVVLCMATAAR